MKSNYACNYSELTINEKINLKGNYQAFGVNGKNILSLVKSDIVTYTMVNAYLF